MTSQQGARYKKTDFLEVRVEPREKQAFSQAAELAGIPLSAWIRERLRKAAIKELEEANIKIPFLNHLKL